MPTPPDFDKQQAEKEATKVIMGVVLCICVALALFTYVILPRLQAPEPTPEELIQ